MAALSHQSEPDIRKARRLVVKIGSALLVDRATGLKTAWLQALALDVAEAKARGADVVLVSSGSIALGRKVLGLPDGALTLEQSQAAAAVGQIRLARTYEEVLAPHGIIAGQVLVTLEDTEDRRRYLNSRATMETLLGFGVVQRYILIRQFPGIISIWRRYETHICCARSIVFLYLLSGFCNWCHCN